MIHLRKLMEMPVSQVLLPKQPPPRSLCNFSKAIDSSIPANVVRSYSVLNNQRTKAKKVLFFALPFAGLLSLPSAFIVIWLFQHKEHDHSQCKDPPAGLATCKHSPTIIDGYAHGSFLHDALAENETSEEIIEAIKKYARYRGDINLRNREGKSPLGSTLRSLHLANREDIESILLTLHRYGAVVNYAEFEAGSPLHEILSIEALPIRKIAAIRVLVEHFKVPVNYKNDKGKTPLDYVRSLPSDEVGSKEIIDSLLELGAKSSSALKGKEPRKYVGRLK